MHPWLVRAEPLEPRRLLSAGDLDPTFGSGGKVISDPSGGEDTVFAVATQEDGGVLVGGSTWTGNEWAFEITRYTAGGALDARFGDDGRVRPVPGLRSAYLRAMTVQTDGKIIAAGNTYDSAADGGRGREFFVVARYTPDGAPDATFGDGGRTVFDIGAGGRTQRPMAVAVQDDGRIVVAGNAEWTFGLARLTTNGALDPTFGTGGTVRTTELRAVQQTGWASVSSLGLTPDGKIVAAGPTGFDYLPTNNFAVARYDRSGRLDTSFAGDGTLEVFLEGSNEDVRCVVGPDDFITVGTTTRPLDQTRSRRDFALLRFYPDGTRDEGFGIAEDPGTNGLVRTDFDGGDDVLYALLMGPDGSLIAAGASAHDPTEQPFYHPVPSDFAIARYDAFGVLDPWFGNEGKRTTDFGRADERVTAVAVDPAGRLVAAGETVNPADRAHADVALARYALHAIPWVVGAQVFYDGGALGDVATADKRPLYPGEAATFDNVTSYTKGLNGILVYFKLPSPRAELRVSLRQLPGEGGGAGRPVDDAYVSHVRRGTGPAGYDQLVLTSDDAVRNGWLAVDATVLLGGLPVHSATFAFGNLVGETGDGPVSGAWRVNALDLAAVKRALNTDAGLTSRYDFNRDGRINALDVAAVKQNLNRSLAVMTVPVPVAAAAALAVERVWREEELASNDR